jgi:tRNA pseudouridine38-40 synthase
MLENRRIKLTVEYDGTNFCGFQRQGQGERTVQEVLELALKEICGRPTFLVPAGRTDTGVHALGQVVHFDLVGRIPTEKICTALNSNLPIDCSVKFAEVVSNDFHARFSALRRVYIYNIWRGNSRSAVFGRYTWHVSDELDLEQMRSAAKLLTGHHDFAAFSKTGGDPGSTTVRNLMGFKIAEIKHRQLIVVKVSANGFLRSMVRNLMGVLIAVGMHEIETHDCVEILKSCDRTKNPCKMAPASGLCLWRVDY